MCLAWWKLPGFLLLYSAAGYQECKGLGLWGLSAQRRRSQQGLCARTLTQSNCYWVLFFVFFTHMMLCSSPADNNWHFFDFETFFQNKEESTIGRLFKRVWDSQLSSKSHSTLSCWGPWGAYPPLTDEPCGGPKWQDSLLSTALLSELFSA